MLYLAKYLWSSAALLRPASRP